MSDTESRMENPMENRPAVLVVDDDREIVQLVRAYLEQDGCRVWVAYDGATALHVLRRETPDLIVLDLMLPDRDGWDLTEIIRGDPRLREIAIIMLTARIEDDDKIYGLEIGADDYVTKPFNPREITARVRSVLRRRRLGAAAPPHGVLRCGPITLDLDSRDVHLHGRRVVLTPTEFKLLRLLMQHPGFVFTRAELLERALGYDYDMADRSLDNHIGNLRRKIEADPANPRCLQTVHGVGYRLVEPAS